MSFSLPGAVARRLLSGIRRVSNKALIKMNDERVLMQLADASHVLLTLVEIAASDNPAEWSPPATHDETHTLSLTFGDHLLAPQAHTVQFTLPDAESPNHFVLRSIDRVGRELMCAKFSALQSDDEWFDMRPDLETVLSARFGTHALHDVVTQARHLQMDCLDLQTDGRDSFTLRGESEMMESSFAFFTPAVRALPPAPSSAAAAAAAASDASASVSTGDDEPTAADGGQKRRRSAAASSSSSSSSSQPAKRVVPALDPTAREVDRIDLDRQRYEQLRLKVLKMEQTLEVASFCTYTQLAVVALNEQTGQVARFTSVVDNATQVVLTSFLAAMHDE